MAAATQTGPIVVGTDGSPSARAAVLRAMDMAAERGAGLHLVRAFRDDPTYGMAPIASIVAGEADRAVSGLAELAAVARARGLACETHCVRGAAADVLTEVAQAVGASCIVVGSRGMHGARRVLGSVPNAVTHKASCDVLLVRTS